MQIKILYKRTVLTSRRLADDQGFNAQPQTACCANCVVSIPKTPAGADQ
jgi:hypothetical protein